MLCPTQIIHEEHNNHYDTDHVKDTIHRRSPVARSAASRLEADTQRWNAIRRNKFPMLEKLQGSVNGHFRFDTQ
jgi:hypothetical protein